MKIKVNGKNIEITDGMRSYLEKKLNYFNKFLDENSVVIASVSTRKNLQKIEIFFIYQNEEIKATVQDLDFYANVNKAIDILKNKVSKVHSLKTKKNRQNVKGSFIDEIEEIESTEPSIVKRKNFQLKPMTEEEAILQMYLLGHPTYIFKNADKNEKICLLYRRDDENLGIIETE